jgi:hypothetical protein
MCVVSWSTQTLPTASILAACSRCPQLNLSINRLELPVECKYPSEPRDNHQAL